MTKSLAEILLFASLGINAALLIFIAGILRSIMNDMDAAAFKNFVMGLYKYSARSLFMIGITNIPFLGAIPYFYYYGFGNKWLLAGLSLWLAAGLIAKAIKVPVYKNIQTLDSTNVARLRDERVKLNRGNILQAVLNTISFFITAIPFINR
jgi:hypothetical protein